MKTPSPKSKTQQLIEALPDGPFAYWYDPGISAHRPEDYVAPSSGYRVINNESELLPHEQLLTKDELLKNRKLAASVSYKIGRGTL